MLGNNATLYISDTHGANTRTLVTHAYPALNPSWSPDSKYVVYTVVAPGTSATRRTVQLQVKATRVADGSSRILGKFSFAAGCSVNATALQIAFAKAQGSYRGTPSTLIWAQPNTVVAQSSCTGQGLTVFRVGQGGTQTLAGWSGGSLSPDGKTVVADVAGVGTAAGRVGVISVATGATKLLAPKLSPGSFAWLANSKVFYTVGQPANPTTGSSTLYRMSPDGKHVSSLGSVKAAGVFHLSLNHTSDHLAMAVVANAPRMAVSPPSTMVYDASAFGLTPTVPLIGGVQPAWRP
jgi:Tol biopolymer transport system component